MPAGAVCRAGGHPGLYAIDGSRASHRLCARNTSSKPLSVYLLHADRRQPFQARK
jgi:hypothetical protein